MKFNEMEIETTRLEVREGFQTKVRGTNDQEYEIYRHNAKALGWHVKSYDEWLAS